MDSKPIVMKGAEGKRRYGIKRFNQGHADDTGWDFSRDLNYEWELEVGRENHAPWEQWGLREDNGSWPGIYEADYLLQSKGETLKGVFFLKYPEIYGETHPPPPDERYFSVKQHPTPPSEEQPVVSIDANADGWVSWEEYNAHRVRTALDDDYSYYSRWPPVQNHRLELSIEMVLADGSVLTAPDSNFAYFVDRAGNRISDSGRISVTTDWRGLVFFYLKAGPLIHKCRHIRMKAVDLTQVAPGP